MKSVWDWVGIILGLLVVAGYLSSRYQARKAHAKREKARQVLLEHGIRLRPYSPVLSVTDPELRKALLEFSGVVVVDEKGRVIDGSYNHQVWCKDAPTNN